jgi:SOS-response transcriptional repressor LexA
MSEKLSINLNLLMTEAHLNAEELSRRIGLPASTIKKIRNNRDANPTLSTLTPLAKYFSLTITQLVGDESFPEVRIKGPYKIDPGVINHIPLITWEDAISWPSLNQPTPDSIATEHTYSKKAYALLVKEDNWENLAKDTALLVEPMVEIEHRDFIIVYKKGQKLPILKQALFDEGQLYLKPVTQGYNIVALTSEHIILGVVVEYKKCLKKSIQNNIYL